MIAISSLLVSCFPQVEPIVIPTNYAAKDLQVLPIEGSGDYSLNEAAFSAGRIRIGSYSQLFRLVEVSNNNETLLLQISIDTLDRNSYQGGTKKYGLYTTYYSTAIVTVTLVDPFSGGIVGLATREGSASSQESYPSHADAVRFAINSAIDAAIRSFVQTL